MSDFYINVTQSGNNLLIREIKNGKRVNRRVKWKPKFFIPSKEDSEWQTLLGQKVKPIEFYSIKEGREFLETYKEQSQNIYGLERHPYVYIAHNYNSIIDWDIDKILIITLDIEVACESGFPDVNESIEPLLCITVKNHSNKAIRVWGVNDFTTDREDVTYIKCDSEIELLKRFIEFWNKIQPDIITGWNTQFFDIPYLCNRIAKLLGEDELNKLSPWNYVRRDLVTSYGRTLQKYNLLGIASLDYIDLYRNFTYTNRESYRLDYIAELELGQAKHENPHETFRDWYTNDYQSFVEYNIQDVELVDALEDKLKLIELCLTMAYEAKANFIDVFSQVRMWDIIIYNFLREQKIVVPMKRFTEKYAKYIGAYVKEPQTGLHKWVMSFDLNSLYPHLIMQYNVSPETLAKEANGEVTIDKLLNKEVTLPKDGYTVTPNGARFRTDAQGFLPALMETLYEDRV